MSGEKRKSLYDCILEAVVDGQLPEDFSLPKEGSENEIMWMDGARDGVNIYHMGFSGLSETDKELMAKAVCAAAGNKFKEADELFGSLGQSTRAITAIDELQAYVIDHKDELSARNIYDYAVYAILHSSDRECVKFGLSLLELFHTDENVELKDSIRILGLSDAFSIFVIFIMRRWKDGNHEIYQLARKIHGWGRVHAVSYIEPETDEIREWLLKDGVHNGVLPAYSALTCWQKSGAENILKGSPTREEFSGIRDIIEGLLDEGPVSGISAMENSADIITLFLNRAAKIDLSLEDYELVREIRSHYESENSGNPVIAALCQEILNSDDCRSVVSEAVKEGKALSLAQDLKLDYKMAIMNLLETDFDKHFYLCNLVMEDLEFRPKVMEIFRRNLPLDEMKTFPADILGLGAEYKRQQQLESIVQELCKYPLEGVDFVETALQSAPVRTRNGGIRVLEMWVGAEAAALRELMPDMYDLLCRLRDIEVRDDVKARMEKLIAGEPIDSRI